MKLKKYNISTRIAALFTAISLMLVFTIVRVAVITDDEKLKNAATEQSTFSLPLYSSRGTVFDSKMRPLTNRSYIKMCIIPPGDNGIKIANKLLSGKSLAEALKTLIAGNPVKCVLGDKETPYGVIEYYSPVRYSGNSLCHILGYLDGEGHGVTGIEKGLDKYLYSDKPAKALFSISAKGEILSEFDADIYEGNKGKDVILTIDRDFQLAVEEEVEKITKGAIIVQNAKTGEIKALSSRSGFNPETAADVLNQSDAPLINRAFEGYSVGSVFKLVVALAALESGFDENTEFYCDGSYMAGGREFHCHQLGGHGKRNLTTAIAESCNVYFYNLANKIGGKKILETAERCGFAASIDIEALYTVPKGNLPQNEDVATEAGVCNLAIGQGKLLISPMHISNFYSAIANGGKYRSPYIVKSVIGEKKTFSGGEINSIMSGEHAEKLKEYLEYSLINGAMKLAIPECNVVAGGKTATVQTGWYENGKEVLNGWYAGFCEIGNQTYVICILRENITTGATDCAPIFARIVDKIYSFAKP